MERINVAKVPMRCLVRYARDLGIDGVFYELVDYLERVGKDTFTESEYASKMRLRLSGSTGKKTDEINEFISRGWVGKDSKSKKYKVLTHPWS